MSYVSVRIVTQRTQRDCYEFIYLALRAQRELKLVHYQGRLLYHIDGKMEMVQGCANNLKPGSKQGWFFFPNIQNQAETAGTSQFTVAGFNVEGKIWAYIKRFEMRIY